MNSVALWTLRLVSSGNVDVGLTSVSVDEEPGVVLGPENEILVALLLKWVDHYVLGQCGRESIVVLL